MSSRSCRCSGWGGDVPGAGTPNFSGRRIPCEVATPTRVGRLSPLGTDSSARAHRRCTREMPAQSIGVIWNRPSAPAKTASRNRRSISAMPGLSGLPRSIFSIGRAPRRSSTMAIRSRYSPPPVALPQRRQAATNWPVSLPRAKRIHRRRKAVSTGGASGPSQ